MTKSAEIYLFPDGELNPDVILVKAREWNLKSVLILGYNDNGEFVIGGSTTNWKDVIWHIYKAQQYAARQTENGPDLTEQI
jgi:hypothetical protein